MNQDPMLPLQPPVVPAAAQAPPPAAAAQHPLAPQFHLHMQGFMDGFAAIPVLGFAPLGPGQFPPPLRRRVAVARRLPPPPPPPPAAVPPQPQNAAGIVAGILQVRICLEIQISSIQLSYVRHSAIISRENYYVNNFKYCIKELCSRVDRSE